MKFRWMSLVVILLLVRVSYALGPHELLLLVNSNSTNSIAIAEEFAELRGLPSINIVPLNIPEVLLDVKRGISTNEFTKYIWEPVNKALAERGIDDHILAWVYSADFPVRILSKPQTSIQGMTFVRNILPEFEVVNKGQYPSPLFAGPVNTNAPVRFTETFDVSNQMLGDDMPIPSMMLGYTGKRGNSVDEVKACLRRGVAADSTFPDGTVWFMDCADVRSKARRWQFAGAKAELAKLNVKVEITPVFPDGADNVMGMIMGKAVLKPENASYRPGCMAEHLTSFGAVFYSASQTKLTAWIKAGATSSAGTIVEPYALWTKFPAARFYVHYAKGCSMMESYYQSIRSPLQILLVGEPLASPWKPKAELLIPDLDGETVSGKMTVDTVVKSEGHQFYSFYMLLVDGKLHSKGNSVKFDSTKVSNGEHTLRVVAYLIGNVRSQIYKEITVKVKNGRGVLHTP